MKQSKVLEKMGNIPFGARTVIREFFIRGKEAVAKENKLRQIGNAAAIAAIGVAHLVPVKQGIEIAEIYNHKDSGIAKIAEGINIAWAAVNSSVVYTQLRLATGLATMRVNRNADEDYNRAPVKIDTLPRDIAITLGASAVWLATALPVVSKL